MSVWRRIFPAFLMLFLTGGALCPATAWGVTVGLPDTTVSPGDSLSVPVRVADFNNIGAVTLKIAYDESVLSFDGVEGNVSGATFLANATGGVISIAWFDATGGSNLITLSSGVLLSLKLRAIGSTGSSSALDLTGGSEIADATATPIPGVVFADGRVTLSGPPPNTDPVLASVGDRTLTEGDSLRIVLSATDADGDSLSFSVSGNPAGSSLTDSVFTWVPDSGQAGTYYLTFTVSDGRGGSDAETITLQVNASAGEPVEVRIDSGTVNVGDSLRVPVRARNFQDVGALTLKIAYDESVLAFDGVEGNVSGATFLANATGGVISIAWFDATGGSNLITLSSGVLLSLKLRAIGSTGSSSTLDLTGGSEIADATATPIPGVVFADGRITLSGPSPNIDPVLSPVGDRTVTEGDSLRIVLSATDADGDSLSFSVSGNPAGSSLSDSVFTWVPESGQAGTYSLTFTVSDGRGGADAETLTLTVGPGSGFILSMFVRNDLTDSITVRFGTAQGATDGIDVALGELEQPPLPPVGKWNVRLVSPSGEGISPDLRSADAQSITWTIQVQPRTGQSQVILTWDPSTFPAEGVFRMQNVAGDASGVDLDMRSQSSAIVTHSLGTTFQIRFSTSKEFTYTLPERWSMISLPVIPADSSLSTLFPNAISAFLSSVNYQQTLHLSPCNGYWINLSSGGDITVTGTALTECVIDLPVSWSMIGGPCCDVPISQIEQNPANNIISAFRFSGNYFQTDTLKAGQGYWVNLAQAGTLTLRCTGGSAKPAALEARAETQPPEHILLAEAGGYQQEIHLGVSPDRVVELPPAPPAGAFDVRVLVDGIGAWQVPASAQTRTFPLQIQGRDVRLRWDLDAHARAGWELAVNGERVPLAGRGSVVVDGPDDTVFIRAIGGGDDTPRAYELTRNTPNPFNLETQIEYHLPEAGEVSIVIYSALGQEVRTLVRAFGEAGVYRVQWDGRDDSGREVSSGVYLYRMDSGAFSKTRRMLLLK